MTYEVAILTPYPILRADEMLLLVVMKKNKTIETSMQDIVNTIIKIFFFLGKRKIKTYQKITNSQNLCSYNWAICSLKYRTTNLIGL